MRYGETFSKKRGEDGLPISLYVIYNVEYQNSESLFNFVQMRQEELVKAGLLSDDYDPEGHKELIPMQAGVVTVTCADMRGLEDYGYKPSIKLKDGLRQLVRWYSEYYR